MFKCLIPLALKKSGSTGILILPFCSLARFGPLPGENQVKSIGVNFDVICLTRTALGQRDFKDRSQVILKSKINYFMTNWKVIIKLLTIRSRVNIR